MTIPPEILFIIDLLASLSPYIIVCLSLNLEFGYAGVANFGKTLSVAGGAFLVGYLPGRFTSWILGIETGNYVANSNAIVTQINTVFTVNPILALSIFILTAITSVIIGAALGFLAAYPVVRLREEYLAMVFLAMGEALLVIGYNYPELVGGTLGIMVPDPFAWFRELRYTATTIIMLFIAILTFIYVEMLTKSPLGRMLRAIRDDEYAAMALGKNVARVRVKTVMLSSAIAALGGVLYAFYSGGVIATAYNRVSWTFWPWVMVILGGTANNKGAVLGTFIFVTIRKIIEFNKDKLTPYVPFDVVWLDMLLLGVALIIILIFKPEGIIPEKPIKTLNLKKP
ncbi:MAG: branched-chain amino acid ABC transporter permease [Candidatus Methanomethylicia archaeon]